MASKKGTKVASVVGVIKKALKSKAESDVVVETSLGTIAEKLQEKYEKKYTVLYFDLEKIEDESFKNQKGKFIHVESTKEPYNYFCIFDDNLVFFKGEEMMKWKDIDKVEELAEALIDKLLTVNEPDIAKVTKDLGKAW
jgi:hypothetical protein